MAKKSGHDRPLIDLIVDTHNKLKAGNQTLDLEPLSQIIASGGTGTMVDHYHDIVHGSGSRPSKDNISQMVGEMRPFLAAIWASAT